MEARLSRTADRGPLLVTLGAAGGTLLVVLGVLGFPAIDSCKDDARGLGACLKGIIDEKFELGGPAPDIPVLPAPDGEVAAVPPAAIQPDAGDTSTVEAPPSAPETQPPATAPSAPGEPADETGVSEPSPPQTAEAPAAPVDVPQPEEPPTPATQGEAGAVPTPHEVIPGSPNAPLDVPTETPTEGGQGAVNAPEPEQQTPLEPAPAFVPPTPTVSVDGVPPDLQVTPGETVTAANGSEAQPGTAPTEPDVGEATPPSAEPEPRKPVEDVPVAPRILTPSIDAIEIEGDGSFVAGGGPEGATMRLYVDGIPVGVSPVEGGRWLVEGENLLDAERQSLRVEAIDPLTGRVIGEAMVMVERPEAAAAAAPVAPAGPVEAAPSATEIEATPGQPVTELAEPEDGPAPDIAEAPVPSGGPEAALVPPVADAAQAPAEPEPTGAQAVTDIPVTPDTPDTAEQGPVTIETLIGAAEPEGAPEPTEGAVADAPAKRVEPPAGPAVIADFSIPEPAAPVAEVPPADAAADTPPADAPVLRAVPIGEPAEGHYISGKAIIRRGDTLWSLAHRYYGRGIRYHTIFEANRDQIARPSRIYPGQVFDLPLVYDD